VSEVRILTEKLSSSHPIGPLSARYSDLDGSDEPRLESVENLSEPYSERAQGACFTDLLHREGPERERLETVPRT
jgi:hypothetical protein